MGAAQPVVWSQLQKLEMAAGGQLIVRSSKRHEPLSLTPLGRKLLEQSSQILGVPAVEAAPGPLAAAHAPAP